MKIEPFDCKPEKELYRVIQLVDLEHLDSNKEIRMLNVEVWRWFEPSRPAEDFPNWTDEDWGLGMWIEQLKIVGVEL